MGNKESQLEAKKEHANPELTIADVIQSIEETVKGIEKVVFEKGAVDSTEE